MESNDYLIIISGYSVKWHSFDLTDDLLSPNFLGAPLG